MTKGIILAGGKGTRLSPLTAATSKQLLPVYDKPMIYYPLSVLMLAGVQDIMVISDPINIEVYTKLLGDGSQWGINIAYGLQSKPNGLPEAYLIANEFLDGSSSLMILGDNIFYGHSLPTLLDIENKKQDIPMIYVYRVAHPEKYGVVDFDENMKVTGIYEKPENFISDFAVTGLYALDENAPRLAKDLSFSKRGELEIVDLLNMYRRNEMLSVSILGRGYAWFDTGDMDDLLDASNFIRTVQKRQGLLIGSPDEAALLKKFISPEKFEKNLISVDKSVYGKLLKKIVF